MTTATTPEPKPKAPEAKPPVIRIEVDWQTIDMPLGQQLYARIREEFERAGKVLNERSNAPSETYRCFMCKAVHRGRPAFVDYSYIDPDTGLVKRVECCSERCVLEYQKFRVDARLRDNLKRAAEERGEEYKEPPEDYAKSK